MISGLTKTNIKHSVHFQVVEADCHLTFVMPQCSFQSHITKYFISPITIHSQLFLYE